MEKSKGHLRQEQPPSLEMVRGLFPEAFRQHGVKSESNLTGSVVKKPVEKVRQVHAPVGKVVEIEKIQYIEKIIEKLVEKVR